MTSRHLVQDQAGRQPRDRMAPGASPACPVLVTAYAQHPLYGRSVSPRSAGIIDRIEWCRRYELMYGADAVAE